MLSAQYSSRDGHVNSRRWQLVFAIWFLALNLHLLRNVSGAYYILVLSILALLVAYGPYRFFVSPALGGYLVFIGGFLYVLFISFVWFSQYTYYTEPLGILNALGRLLLVAPTALFVAGKRWECKDVDLIIKIFVAFIAVGALTVPLQFIIGPISWFVAPSTRSGFDRFGSLFGNLTSLGIVGGLGIIATLYSTYSARTKALILCGISLGLLLSLQKAAVANSILAALLLIYFHPAQVTAKIKYFAFILFAALLILATLQLAFGQLATATLTNFRLSGGEGGFDDYTLVESIFQRLIELPRSAIDFFGATAVIWGVGFAGSAGVAGYEEMPMAHNFFVDLILMGGFILPLIFIGFLILVFAHLRRGSQLAEGEKRLHFQFARAALIYIVINLPFASGVIFQPNVGVVFWWVVGLIMSGYFVPITQRVASENV